MPLTSTRELILRAAENNRGLVAFNVAHLEQATALIRAAEATNAPLILQISENTVSFHGDLEPLSAATFVMAHKAEVPVAAHLDHATSPELIQEALKLGFTSVMFDGSTLEYADNIAATADIVSLCHQQDVFVEAELGEVGGKNGIHDPTARTDPAEAQAFVTATGVDALAVAVGTSHAMTTQEASVDVELIGQLHRAVPVPLVLHGSSGVPDMGLVDSIASGITKVNIATRLTMAFTRGVRAYLEAHPDPSDTRPYIRAGADNLTAEAQHLLTLLCSEQHR